MLPLIEKVSADAADTSSLDKNLSQLVSGGLGNPKLDLNDVARTITNISDFFVKNVMWVVLAMVIYSSFVYLTSYGDESKIETAKKTMIWTVVGVFIIAFSKIILMILTNAFNRPGH